jgi:magnesium transporter
MAKFTRKYNRKRIGLPPGSTEHLQEEGKAGSITTIRYNEDSFSKSNYDKLAPLDLQVKPGETLWLNFNSLNRDWVEMAGEHFNIHPLFREDILHTGQRPKLDEGEDYLFLVANMLGYSAESNEVLSEQVSFVFNQQYLLTFQEKEGDIFDPIRLRIEVGKGRIRKGSADYLAYTLLDVIVDQFYIILEQIGNKIETLESQVVQEPSMSLLQEINKHKRDLIFIRKNIWPLREVLNGLMRSEQVIISKTTRFYVKDIYDHTIQIMDSLDTYREMLSSILDIYMSSTSNKLNNVMKTLTIIATIFIPLTFLVGVYGMNFQYMPELEWKYGYFLVWGIMVATTAGLLVYFKRKGWL